MPVYLQTYLRTFRAALLTSVEMLALTWMNLRHRMLSEKKTQVFETHIV